MRRDKNNKYVKLIAKDKLSGFTFGLRRPTISFIISTISLITFSIAVFNRSKEKQTTFWTNTLEEVLLVNFLQNSLVVDSRLFLTLAAIKLTMFLDAI